MRRALRSPVVCVSCRPSVPCLPSGRPSGIAPSSRPVLLRPVLSCLATRASPDRLDPRQAQSLSRPNPVLSGVPLGPATRSVQVRGPCGNGARRRLRSGLRFGLQAYVQSDRRRPPENASAVGTDHMPWERIPTGSAVVRRVTGTGVGNPQQLSTGRAVSRETARGTPCWPVDERSVEPAILATIDARAAQEQVRHPRPDVTTPGPPARGPTRACGACSHPCRGGR